MFDFLKKKKSQKQSEPENHESVVRITDSRLEFRQIVTVNEKYGILSEDIRVEDLIPFIVEKVFFRGYEVSKTENQISLSFEMSSKYAESGNYAPPSNLLFSFLVESETLHVDPAESRSNVDPPGICDGLTWLNGSVFYKDKKNQDNLDYFFTAYTVLNDNVRYGCFYLDISTFFYIQYIITRLCTHQSLTKFSGLLANITKVNCVGMFSFNVDLSFNGFFLSKNNKILFIAFRINKLIPCIVSCSLNKLSSTEAKNIREKESYIGDLNLMELPENYIYVANPVELSYIRDDDKDQRILTTYAYMEPPIFRKNGSREPYRFIQVFPTAYAEMMEKVVKYTEEEISPTLEFKII